MLAWALIILAAVSAPAQDALRSALSLDTAIAANTNAPVLMLPDQPHIGPVQFSLGAYTGATYDDNINGSQQDPETDYILSTGLNLGAYWQATDHSGLQFGTGIGYVRYLKNTQNSGIEITPNSALTYAVSLADVTVTIFDQLSYTRQVTTDAALANVASLPVLDNTVGTRAGWNPGQWTLQASYSHDEYLGINNTNNYLNRSSEYLFGRLGWRFADATEAGTEVSGSTTAYEVASQSSYRSVSLGGYVQWQLRQLLQLSLRGGPTFYTFDSSTTTPGYSLTSYYLSFQASHQLTDFLSHRLSLDRSVQPGLNNGSGYTEQLTASYSVSWAVTQRIGLGASVTYENGRQPLQIPLPGGFSVQANEQYQRYGVGPQVSWKLTDKLAGSLTFNHSRRESNLDGRSYADNSVTINFNYAF